MLNYRVILPVLTGVLVLGCSDVNANKASPNIEIKSDNMHALDKSENETLDMQSSNIALLRNNIVSYEKVISLDMILLDIRKLYNLVGYEDLKTLSDEMWSGKAKTPRNPHASALVAYVLNDIKQEQWSALRTGIAFEKGLGFDRDIKRSEQYLSLPILKKNATAHYFLSQLKSERNERVEAEFHLRKAARLGHRKARSELEIE